MTASLEPRVGLCGIGLDAYWPQFEGMRARLEGYLREAGARLENVGAVVEFLGMVDTPQRGRRRGTPVAAQMWTC